MYNKILYQPLNKHWTCTQTIKSINLSSRTGIQLKWLCNQSIGITGLQP